MLFNKTFGCPDCSFEKLTDIKPSDIIEMGARAIALDLDRTATYFASYYIHQEAKEWVKMMQDAGIPVMIVSNTVKSRAKLLSLQMGNIPCYAPAFKPGTKGLDAAAEIMNTPIEKIAMIGDKLESDILAANKTGAVAVKVDPLLRENIAEKFRQTLPRVAAAALAISIIHR